MPAPLTIPLDEARAAFLAELTAFEAAGESLDDISLLGASRAHGWSRLDCIVHVRMGLQELLAGMNAQTDEACDVDAASYWTTWEDSAVDDPVPGILMTRRTASAYTRPTHCLEHLRHVCTGLRRAAQALPDEPVAFQSHVLSAGDLLATWAVELVVHHLDLDVPNEVSAPGPALAATALARRTVVAIDAQVDYSDDTEAVLRGFGRLT